MLRPAALHGVEPVTWLEGGRLRRYPAVLEGWWRAPDGREAVALANWTRSERDVLLPVEIAPTICHLHGATVESRNVSGRRIALPPLSVAIVEYEAGDAPERVGSAGVPQVTANRQASRRSQV
jgi:uncharacterized lipoprotein YbaY